MTLSRRILPTPRCKKAVSGLLEALAADPEIGKSAGTIGEKLGESPELQNLGKS